MRNHPWLIWTFAAGIALALFWFPLVNGVLAGVFGGWFEDRPHVAAGHAIAISAGLIPALWIITQYGVVLPQFAHVSGLMQTAWCVLPMLLAAVFTSLGRTMHLAPNVRRN